MKKLAERFGFRTIADDIPPRYNIAPSQMAPVVLRRSPNRLELMRWGLIPHWAKEEKIGYKMINARAETLAQKPSFKRPFQKQRCLVLADGFYEWQAIPQQKHKQPMRITLKDEKPFAFAGLWDRWEGPQKEIYSFTIITTRANEKLKEVHERMPVILQPQDEAAWLNPDEEDLNELQKLLRPYSGDAMNFYPVSTAVNSPKNDQAELILPLAWDGDSKAKAKGPRSREE